MGRGMIGTGGMGTHAINGGTFDMHRIDERVRLSDVEIWEASGEMMAHPLHIPGVQFDLLSRGGAPAGPRDKSLRDTVCFGGE